MKKNPFIEIIIGLLTVSSLLLALVFAPIRGGSYSESSTIDKAFTKVGVDLKGNLAVAKVNTINNLNQVNGGIDFPGTTTSNQKMIQTTKDEKITLENNSNQPFGKVTNTAPIKALTSYERENSIVNSNHVDNFAGLATTPILYNSFKKGVTTSNAIAQAGGYITSPTNPIEKTAAKLSGPQKGHGGPPPEEGGSGGGLPSLPIGNGTWFLLSLALLFGSWKFKNLTA